MPEVTVRALLRLLVLPLATAACAAEGPLPDDGAVDDVDARPRPPLDDARVDALADEAVAHSLLRAAIAAAPALARPARDDVLAHHALPGCDRARALRAYDEAHDEAAIAAAARDALRERVSPSALAAADALRTPRTRAALAALRAVADEALFDGPRYTDGADDDAARIERALSGRDGLADVVDAATGVVWSVAARCGGDGLAAWGAAEAAVDADVATAVDALARPYELAHRLRGALGADDLALLADHLEDPRVRAVRGAADEALLVGAQRTARAAVVRFEADALAPLDDDDARLVRAVLQRIAERDGAIVVAPITATTRQGTFARTAARFADDGVDDVEPLLDAHAAKNRVGRRLTLTDGDGFVVDHARAFAASFDGARGASLHLQWERARARFGGRARYTSITVPVVDEARGLLMVKVDQRGGPLAGSVTLEIYEYEDGVVGALLAARLLGVS